MESKLYMYPRYRKVVKSTSGLTEHFNVCKILIVLPYCQTPSEPEEVLEYNTTNPPDLLSDNNKKNIRPTDIDK